LNEINAVKRFILKIINNMTAIIDKQLLRESLIDLVATEPDFVRELIAEIDIYLKKSEGQSLEEITFKIFNKYDDVFKALA
jgi:23S rRNA maturation-related 3'-5' exoribonuclease YhaM